MYSKMLKIQFRTNGNTYVELNVFQRNKFEVSVEIMKLFNLCFYHIYLSSSSTHNIITEYKIILHLRHHNSLAKYVYVIFLDDHHQSKLSRHSAEICIFYLKLYVLYLQCSVNILFLNTYIDNL